MKLTKDELKEKISTLEISPEIQIELLEDIEDSMEVQTEASDGYKEKYEAILEKYKARFLTKEDDSEAASEDKEVEDSEVEEKEVIDIKEI